MDRERIAEGIHRDQYGYDVRIKVKGCRPFTKRLDKDMDPLKVIAWRLTKKAELLDRAADAGGGDTVRGTLADAVPRYLKQIAGRAGWKADRSHLRAWVKLYGQLHLTRITSELCSLATAQWKTAGVADKTVLHRCRVLRELYQTLDKHAKHPIADAKKPKTPHPTPVEVPLATIRLVDKRLKAARDAQAYARFRVLVTTGQRPCQVMRAQPIDVSLKKNTWIVRPAKNEGAHTVYLNADMRAAWRLFIIAHAWGAFDTTKQARLLRECGWPVGIRPYNARHSIAFAALEAGADLGDLQGLLGHKQIQTTRTTYGPLQAARQKRVSDLLTGRFAR